MEIRVEGSLDQAMRVLKRKLAKEGVFKEMKKRAFYEKPSVKRKRKIREARKRRRREMKRRGGGGGTGGPERDRERGGAEGGPAPSRGPAGTP